MRKQAKMSFSDQMNLFIYMFTSHNYLIQWQFII